jgi:hypothetical protein
MKSEIAKDTQVGIAIRASTWAKATERLQYLSLNEY